MFKRKFLGIIVVFLCFLLLTQVGTLPKWDSDSPTLIHRNAPVKYTYISYICADNNLGTYARTDVNEMELGYNDSVTDVHIITLLDLLSGGTTAYYISHDSDMNSITSTILTGTGLPAEANMGDPNTLYTYLNFVITNYPADHYILDFWDHGSGFEVCFDESSGNDALTMAEIRSVLETINVTIDIIAMDACMMGTLEVAYELQNVASILIASEDAILAAGFPYDTVIADLCADPTQNITEFAGTVVDLFHAEQFSFFASSLAAINLTRIDNSISTAFTTFAQDLHDYLDYGIKNELYNALIATETFYDWDFIDLYDFAQNVKAEATNLTIVQNALDLMDNISAAIINEKHNLNDGAYGLSIYFPRSQSSYDNEYPNYFSLTNDSMWDEFLIKYYVTANFGLGLHYYELNDFIGNNNNTPDPGETLQVLLELENVGDILGENINGSLFCTDTSNVTILDSPKSYGALNPGTTASRLFTFNISASAVIGQVLPFILMTRAKFSTYTITRNFTIEFVVGREITIGGATLQTATTITVGHIYGHLPGPGATGESWLKLYCIKEQYLLLNLSGPALTDFDAYVYSPDQKLVSVAGKATYPDICSIFLLQEGYYNIKLIAFGSGSGYYEMGVNFTSSAYEDGLAFGTAFTLAGNSTTNGVLPGPNSSQYIYYRVILQANQILRVHLEGDIGTDFDLYIYNPNLDEVARSTSSSSSEECVIKTDAVGYYYIILSRYSGSGAFTLEVSNTVYIFPTWLIILIVLLIVSAVIIAVAFYYNQMKKAQARPPPESYFSDFNEF